MNVSFRRIFSFILSVVMVFSCMSVMSFQTFAVSDEVSFTKVSAIEDGKTYVITAEGMGMTAIPHSGYMSNSGGYEYSGFAGTAVTTSDDKITSTVTEDMLWTAETVNGGFAFKNASNGQYLAGFYAGMYAENGIMFSTTADAWTLSSSKLKNVSTDKYLAWDKDSDVNGGINLGDANLFTVRSSSNADNVTLYVANGNVDVEDPTPDAPDHTDSTYLAFTADIHNTGAATSKDTGANNLTNWLANIPGKIGGTFEVMGFCGDNGDSNTNGDTYWSRVQTVMDVVDGSDKVAESIFINGNHEYQNGNQSSSSNATAKKIKGIGYTKEATDYIIYVFGAASQSQSFNQSDITNLDNYLKNVAKTMPVFVMSHFPLHYDSNRTTSNAQALLDVLNKYPNVIFLWGHNHTTSDPHYDNVYLAGDTIKLESRGSEKEINFTYAAAGCMGNTSYAHAVQADGLVAKVDGSAVTLTYYSGSASVVGTAVTVDVSTGSGTVTPDPDPTPDTPVTPDPDPVPDKPIPDPNTYTFTKVTSIEDGKTYVITAEGMGMTATAHNGYTNNSGYSYSGLAGTAVTTSDDKITSTVTKDMLWTAESVSGGFAFKNENNGQYLAAFYEGRNGDNGIKFSTTADAWTLSNSKLKSVTVSSSASSDKFLAWDNDSDVNGGISNASGSANLFTIRSSSIADAIILYCAEHSSDHVASYTQEIIEPTCGKDGYTLYTCTVCGLSFASDYVSALGHSFTNYVSNNDATCTEDGTMTAVCENANCGATSTIVEKGSAFGHSYKSVVTSPTCTKYGYTTYTCGTCGDSYTNNYVSETGHKFSDESEYCLVCHESVSNALEYTIINGEVTVTCCDKLTTGKIIIPAEIKGYPVTKIGSGAFENCAYLNNVSIPDSVKYIGAGAFNGTAITEIVISNPNCVIEYDGSTIPESAVIYGHIGSPAQMYAQMYGRVFVALAVAECKHSFGEWIINTDATCTQRGFSYRVCAYCKEYDFAMIEPKGHIDADKNEICDICDTVLSVQLPDTSPCTHVYGEWTISSESTCTTVGFEYRECLLCKSYEFNVLGETGHNDADEDNVCDICDEVLVSDEVESGISQSFIENLIAYLNKIIEMIKSIFNIA